MAAFLLSLREGLEAALIVSILLGALRRLGRGELGRFVWSGVAAAALLSAAVAGGLVAAGIEMEGRAEQLFEGVMLLLAAAFLTGMIFWMQRQGAAWRKALAAKVQQAASTGGWALFAVAFLAVAREGIELALLLVATALQGSFAATGLGVTLGLGVAIGCGALLYRGVLRLNLVVFFRITNVLLLLFAAGMVGLAAHELIEAGLLPAIVAPLWNINPILSDQSAAGALLRSLFGYSGAPALTEALAYVAYLGAIGWALWRRQASAQVATASA